jgi:epoxyqueuosine reductase
MMRNSLSESIKSKAKGLGFQKVGIAKAEPTREAKRNLDQWLNVGNHATMKWIAKRKDERGDIHTYFPEAKSVISVGMNYFVGKDQSDITTDFKFSNYAWGDDYHDLMKNKLFHLLTWLKEENPGMKGIVCVDTSPVMDKVWAQKAGLGWQGKHTNLISRDYGSWLFLGELLLDIELDYDPIFNEDLCGSCTACIDACPTHALGEYTMDSRKCISYQSIEYRGDFSDIENLYGWIYGCDICQEVCPWNQKFSQVSTESSFQPRKEFLEWSNEDWTKMDKDGFRKLFKGSAAKRTKFSGLNRNINQNIK